MAKILGIDTGTNSLGWAVVQSNEDGTYKLLYRGDNIFQEGVKVEKGIESSKAADRTVHRSIRRHYWRRKVRKLRLLTVLAQENLCPPVSVKELRDWRSKKIYPQNELFMQWQRTDDNENVNPYYYRYLCLTKQLDLSDISQRYILGRALYHLNQRRGFLSNRNEDTKESDGNVKQGISQLTEDIKSAGCRYLGEYFYKLYQQKEKIRKHYTARNEHYLEEFRAICNRQNLPHDLSERLEKIIFAQRPPKSQKHLVGKCTFEPKKVRCSVSHPLFEEYRMYSFINNVKIKTPSDYDLRPLTSAEKDIIRPLFLRKSKPTFNFDDIAKKLSGKRDNYCYVGDKVDKPYKFNYHLDTQVAGSPVCAQLCDVFGNDWKNAICEVYIKANGKSRLDIMNDIWHVLYTFDDVAKLKTFAIKSLQLSDEDAEKFSSIKMSKEYASLSLKAITKILPYLRDYGLIYSEAVFLANLCDVLPSYIWNAKEMRESVIQNVIDVMHDDESGAENQTTEQRVKDFLKDKYDVKDEKLKKLYHPSMIDVYPRQRRNDRGIYQLGSPRIDSVRNPMAMHSLFRLRKVVNSLLAEGKIDEDTEIHIEFARELNDANRRKAIKSFQRTNETEREVCRKRLVELLGKEPSDREILKYQLWEEQNHKCIYTGNEIGCMDFLGNNPGYDIEHTIPRSAGGDSTKMNLTLCQSKFNREVKKTLLPSQLANHEDILQRIEQWKDKADELDRNLRKLRGSYATTKDAKDAIIQRKHQLALQRDYWRGKYNRFTMTEVPEGFARRQDTDNCVIARYARLYLRSVFKKVYIVKGIATSDFRKLWGIQDEYEKKSRDNHVHHCIDAVTIACIGLNEYGRLARYYHDLEDSDLNFKEKPQFSKPWPSFVEDMKRLHEELLVVHYTQDNMPKIAGRRIYVGDRKVLAKGDVARGSLHQDTFYGAIERDGDVKYVVRKELVKLETTDIKNIVDDVVREKVEDAVKLYGGLNKAIQHGIWMNEAKGIRILKVRLYAGTVTRPINMRHHRDASRHEYKQQYHVQNDRNYMMAIYSGKDSKGKEKREFELVNNITAAQYYKSSNRENGSIVPEVSKKGYGLKYLLKIGTLVLLYDKSPDEIWELSNKDLLKRLYKVTGMSSMDISGNFYGTIVLQYHQEARRRSDLKVVNGAYSQGENLRPCIKMLHTQIKALVAGTDFEINELGEVKRLR